MERSDEYLCTGGAYRRHRVSKQARAFGSVVHSYLLPQNAFGGRSAPGPAEEVTALPKPPNWTKGKRRKGETGWKGRECTRRGGEGRDGLKNEPSREITRTVTESLRYLKAKRPESNPQLVCNDALN